MDLRSPRPTATVRRNPPRRAKQTPITAAPPSSAAAVAAAGITPFPLHDILAADPSQIPPPTPTPSKSSAGVPPRIPPPTPNEASSHNLKVFLRIRPLEIRTKATGHLAGDRARARGKGVSPKGAKKSQSKDNICLVVNDSSSVTLSAPNSLLDPKRTKSEVYDGFTHVFPPGSNQNEIYERVMAPLVLDFMGGKSALLAAMGPSGSGKTHTMFGCPREPGMVPLALEKIFCHGTDSGVPHTSRSYYLSMFEIYSERGKGERIFDLLPDGADLYLQQSNLKGLQEIMISNVVEAHSLIARGMLKRTTAATNTNNQSSRSQCIINIRGALESIDNENNFHANCAVLTIADLAGAEKEKKTGNQGARLLESNFINNTSMVFGLCLRSLLEHQKNPKKPFQKHFKNSLLTRYLKEYMEGKKRMILILTVKPGENDYPDTSFLLRQASPYMKIKFNNSEEIPNVPCQKRSTTIFIRTELLKRRKYNNSEAPTVDGGKIDMGAVTRHEISEKEVNNEKQQETETPESSNTSPNSLKAVQMGIQPNEERYDELRRVRRNVEVMETFSKALWNVLKQYKQKLEASEEEVQSLKENVEKKTTQIKELEMELEGLNLCCSCHNHSMKESSISEVDVCAFVPPLGSENPNDLENIDAAIDDILTPLASEEEVQSLKENVEEKTSQIMELEKELKEINLCCSCDNMSMKESSISVLDTCAFVAPLGSENPNDLENIGAATDDNITPLPELTASFAEDARHNGESQVRNPLNKENHEPFSKPSNAEKPRRTRRLQPASAMLLKEFSGLGMEVENPKESRSKQTVEGRERSQGSVSLVHLIKNNLPH